MSFFHFWKRRETQLYFFCHSFMQGDRAGKFTFTFLVKFKALWMHVYILTAFSKTVLLVKEFLSAFFSFSQTKIFWPPFLVELWTSQNGHAQLILLFVKIFFLKISKSSPQHTQPWFLLFLKKTKVVSACVQTCNKSDSFFQILSHQNERHWIIQFKRSIYLWPATWPKMWQESLWFGATLRFKY